MRPGGAAARLGATGLPAVLLAQGLCKVLTFFGGTVLVRLLSKSDYGAYAYVMNCYGMLVLLNDLGSGAAAVQLCSEAHRDPARFDALLRHGFVRGLACSALTAGLIFLSPWFYPFRDPASAKLVRGLCLMPFLFVPGAFLAENLRLRLCYGRYSAVSVFQTGVRYLFLLPLTCRLGVPGAVYSTYAVALAALAFTLALSRGKLGFLGGGPALDGPGRREFGRLALVTQLNNGAAQGLMMLDVFLLGVLAADNEAISTYKIAGILPAALGFLPRAVMTCLVPRFARHCREPDWVGRAFRRVVLAGAGVYLAVAAGCAAAGPWLLPLVFGRQYADAAPCFTALMAGYFFYAAFRCPVQQVLCTQRRVRANLAITLACGALNCGLDVVCILEWGAVGAAWATAAVHAGASAAGLWYFRRVLREGP